MYAVIKTGGKQYRVAANDVIEVEKLAGEPGDIIELGQVLLVSGDGGTEIGKPLVGGASVAAEVMRNGRGARIIIFKKRRRHHYRRRNGHRQDITTLRITEILTEGRKPSKKKAEPRPAAEASAAAARSEAKAEEKKPERKAKAPAARRAPAKPRAESKAKPKPKKT